MLEMLEIKDSCSEFRKNKVAFFFGNKINELFNIQAEHITVCLVKGLF